MEKTEKQDHKRFLRALGVLVLIAILAMDLPHLNRSLVEYILPPIRFKGGGALYLTGLIILVSVIWAYREMVKSNYLKMNRFLRVVLVFFLLIPLIFDKIDLIKTPYYIFSKGLKPVELVDSNLIFEQETGKKDRLIIDLTLKNYSKNPKSFSVSIERPEEFKDLIDEPVINLQENYTIGPKEQRMHVYEKVDLASKIQDQDEEGIVTSSYYTNSYKINLYNKYESLSINVYDAY